MLLQQNWTPYGHHACNTCCVPYRLMATAPVQATQQATATRSNQPGARTGSPALATAPWMSSTPPPPSGQSACLPLWDSLPVYHSGTVCQSTTLGQSACLPLWDSLQVYYSGTVCLLMGLTAHVCVCLCIYLCVCVVIGLLYMAYPKGINYLLVHLPVCRSYVCLYLCVCLCLHAVIQPFACQLPETQSKHANDIV